MSLSKPDTGEGTLSMSSIHGALSSGATLSWIWPSSPPRPIRDFRDRRQSAT